MSIWLYILLSTISIPAACILDILIGDPEWFPHPVRFVGKLISLLEKKLKKRSDGNQQAELLAGVALTVITCAVCFIVPAAAVIGAYIIHPVAGVLLEIILSYFLLAARCLTKESMSVAAALKSNDMFLARQRLSRIVGRDTEKLDKTEIIKATVETVSENTTDGVIAPLFYILIGGTALGWFYKAVNTMDSMIGYKNRKYFYFGKTAARLDDTLNFIPSRLSAVIMIFASAITGMNHSNARRIWKRDRRKHKSPNSAQTESVCAGALEIELGGNAYYFGELVFKDTIGDPIRKPRIGDINRANLLMWLTGILFFILIILFRSAVVVITALLFG